MRLAYYPYGIQYDLSPDKFIGIDDVSGITLEYPLNLIFNTSHECNLHCEYCFRRGSRLRPQSTAEIMSDLGRLPVGKPMRLVLSGGEPFWRSAGIS